MISPLFRGLFAPAPLAPVSWVHLVAITIKCPVFYLGRRGQKDKHLPCFLAFFLNEVVFNPKAWFMFGAVASV